MANVILVLGESGTGKSTAIRTLDPKETFIIGTTRKPLPFVGSAKLYSVENKNYFATTNAVQIQKIINSVNDSPPFKNLVIDDAGFVMTDELFSKIDEKGYSKFESIAANMVNIIRAAQLCRENLTIFIVMHTNNVYTDLGGTVKEIRMPGKMVSEKFDPPAVVSIALYSNVTYDKAGNASFNFITKRSVIRTPGGASLEIPAKSPEGMFEETMIPNDFQLVADKARAYYGL